MTSKQYSIVHDRIMATLIITIIACLVRQALSTVPESARATLKAYEDDKPNR